MPDDPNVNKLFLKLLAETREEKQHSRLVDLGIPMYKIFDESPVKRADYEKITTAIERDYVLQFCSQRWIENARVAERAENVWEKYLQIIDFWKTLPRSKQPGQDKPGANKIYDTLLKKASDLLLLVKLELFKEVVDLLNSFTVTLQTHAPMVPLHVVKLEEIVRFYCSRFVLPVTMKKANSALKLIKFDFFYENIYWPDVEVRYGIAEELRKLENKGKIKDDPIHKFKRECRSFLATLFKHMVEKSPLQSSFVHFSRALSPVYMAEK